MAELPEQVYRDAWGAAVDVQTDEPINLPQEERDRIADMSMGPGFRAAVESAYRAGYLAGVQAEPAPLGLDGKPCKHPLADRIDLTGLSSAVLEYACRVCGYRWTVQRQADPVDHVVAHHEDQTYAEIADVKRGEDQ